MRNSKITRNTTETRISLTLLLDGKGSYDCKTGAGFLDHMLELMTRHGRFDLDLEVTGDTHVDFHHTVEDTGIALGSAFSEALGDMRGISRYGSFILPMDESLVLVALDFSGRAYLNFDMQLSAGKIGDFDTELVQEFFLGFCRASGLTLHIKQLAGGNTHHLIEAAFKGFGHALKQAVALEAGFENEIPSTKGMIK